MSNLIFSGTVDEENNRGTDRLYREALEMGSGPGKFEGQGVETRYFWLRMMDGDGDNIYSDEYSGASWDLLDVNDYEQGLFGVPASSVCFEVYTDSQGFVSGRFLTADEEKTQRERAEKLIVQDAEVSEDPDSFV